MNKRVEAPQAEPVREYASFTLTIDHLRHTRMQEDGENAVVMIASNLTPGEQLLKQIDYFAHNTGEGANIMRHGDVIKLLARYGDDDGCIWLYTPSDRLSNIILSANTFGGFCDEFGGLYGAHVAILALAIGITMESEAKGLPSVLIPIVAGTDHSRMIVISPATALADAGSSPVVKTIAALAMEKDRAEA